MTRKKCNSLKGPYNQRRPQDLGGGGLRIFFFRFGNLHVAMRHAAHGLAMRIAFSPEKIFLNGAIWCVLGCILIRFCLYFFFKNYHFLYKKINILDKLLLWGYFSGRNFENMLRLMHFGVYLETKMAIFIRK